MKRLSTAIALALAMLGPVGCNRSASKRETKAPTTQVSVSARQQFERGVAHLDEGAAAYDKAIAAFEAAIQAAPDLWEAWLDIGVIELRRARLTEAAKAFERSVELFASPEGLEGLGEVYLRQGRPKKAVELYERALQRDPSNATLRVRLAVSLHHAGKLDAAQAEARAVLSQHAGDPLALATMAAIEIDRDHLELAELILNRALVRNPDHPALLTNLGLIAWKRGDDQAAFTLFEKAGQADAMFLTGRLNKAAVYLGSGNHSRAREELEFVLQVEPGNAQALLGLGIAQRLAGEPQNAQKTWNRLLSLDPDNAAAHFNLGVLAMDGRNDPAGARKHLERYLQLTKAKGADGAGAKSRVADAKERLELLAAMQASQPRAGGSGAGKKGGS